MDPNGGHGCFYIQDGIKVVSCTYPTDPTCPSLPNPTFNPFTGSSAEFVEEVFSSPAPDFGANVFQCTAGDVNGNVTNPSTDTGVLLNLSNGLVESFSSGNTVSFVSF
jgi:hypothetical protein